MSMLDTNTVYYWNIGIAFSHRPNPKAKARGILKPHEYPDWSIIIEADFPGIDEKQRYTSGGWVRSYTIKRDRETGCWKVVISRKRTPTKHSDSIAAILHLGSYPNPDLTRIENWLINHVGAEERACESRKKRRGRNNGRRYRGQWYSATWVIMVLDCLQHSWGIPVLGGIPSWQLHELVHKDWKEKLKHKAVHSRTTKFIPVDVLTRP